MGCNCKNCKDVTLFKGSDGVGIQHIEFSGCCEGCENTFTIFLTDGTTYTSPNLKCNSCPLYANIILNEDNTLTAKVSGGTAPYTYQWSIADNGQYIGFDGSTTEDTVTLIDIPSPPPNFTSGLVKVVVTDANGCSVNDVFLYYIILI
jgi:hypothetical protein